MDAVNQNLNALRQAMDGLNASYDYRSVNDEPLPETLANDFCKLYNSRQQADFCKYVRKNHIPAFHYFQEVINAPQPRPILAMFDQACERKTNAAESSRHDGSSAWPDPIFCGALTYLRKVSNTFNSVARLNDGFNQARTHLAAGSLMDAFDTCRLLSAASTNITFESSKLQQTFLADFLPTAMASSNRFIQSDVTATILSGRWGIQFFELHNEGLKNPETNKSTAYLFEDEHFQQVFGYAYRTVKLSYDLDPADDIYTPNFMRSYRLFRSVHHFISAASQAASSTALIEHWKSSYSKEHDRLRIEIGEKAKSLLHAGVEPLEGLLFDGIDDDLQQVSEGNFAAGLAPLFEDSEILLGLPWVKALKKRLQQATKAVAKDTTSATKTRIPTDRTCCLESEPGTGKTEAIKYILRRFSEESRAADAASHGWHGPLLAFFLDSEHFYGQHYNESAMMIRGKFQAIRRKAQRDGGVAAVFVDEINRFLAGSQSSGHQEDSKNMLEFTRLLDNSIDGNALFFLCATNAFDDLALPVKSRLQQHRVRYETPMAFRVAAIKNMVEGWDMKNPFILKWASPTSLTEVSSSDNSTLLAALTGLSEVFSLRELCSIVEAASSCTMNLSTPNPYDGLDLFYTRYREAHFDRYKTQNKILHSAGLGTPLEENMTYFYFKSFSAESIKKEKTRISKLNAGGVVHLINDIEANYANTIFMDQNGIHLLASRSNRCPILKIEMSAVSYYGAAEHAIDSAALTPRFKDAKSMNFTFAGTGVFMTIPFEYTNIDTSAPAVKPDGTQLFIAFKFQMNFVSKAAKDIAEPANLPQTISSIFAA